jgi:lipid A 3-O-deacylase
LRDRRLILTLLVLVLFLGGATAARAGVHSLALWGGKYDAFEADSSNELGAELRFEPLFSGEAPLRWDLAPAVSVMRTADDATFIHAGFRLDLPLTDRFRLTAQSGAGYYDAGDDKDLGGHLQFRSGLEAAWRLSRRQELGLLLYHLSNAGINSRNPGEESLVLQWAWTF